MGEKGSACSACLQQVGRTFVLPQYIKDYTILECILGCPVLGNYHINSHFHYTVSFSCSLYKCPFSFDSLLSG